MFEIVSPTELRNRRARDRKRRDLQDAEGVEDLVEIFQDEAAAHIYRRVDGGAWSFELVEGLEAVLNLRSVGFQVPLAEIHETVALEPDARNAEPG